MAKSPRRRRDKENLAQPEAQRVIVHDGYDDMAFEGVSHYERIQDLMHNEQGETDEVAEALMQDIFTAFHRIEPKLDEEKKSLTKEVMGQLLDMSEYKTHHENSKLDGVASALGAIHMTPILMEKINEIREQVEEKREQQREQNRQNNPDGDENEGVPEGEASLDELGEDGMASVRQALRQSIEKAQEENEEVQGCITSWGVGKGEYNQMDAQERLEFADELRRAGKLQDAAKLIGRFKNVVTATLATTPSHGNDEIVDIGQGDDIARMVPSELMKLIHNEDLFFKDFAEKSLLVYNLKGVENKGKGPLIVAWDRSGSMGGQRESWAVACVLSLLQLAIKENRAFAWVSFDDGVEDSNFYPKGMNPPLAEKMKIAQMGTGGGTNFMPALREVMKLHAQEPELKPADVVFITDGECSISEDDQEKIANWKKEKEVRIFGIGISDSSSYEKADIESLNEFCDQTCVMTSSGDISPLKAVVNYTIKARGAK